MKPLLTAVLLALLFEVSVGAQDPLTLAKDLYASAAYEDALSALARIDEAAAPAVAGRSTSIAPSAFSRSAARARPKRSPKR